jgi:hypothetical protein
MTLRGTCKACGAKFKWLSSNPNAKREFCSRRCNLKEHRERRRKLPDGEKLRELYVKQGLSTPEIARMYNASDPKTVREALIKAGVKLRGPGPRKRLTCAETGCNNPVQRILHKGNGSLYGTLCKMHRILQRRELGREYTRRMKKIPPERWALNRDGSRRPMPAEQREKIRKAVTETKQRQKADWLQRDRQFTAGEVAMPPASGENQLG